MAADPTGRISHIPEMHRGFSWKPACRVATTATITISTALNNGDTLDGVTLATGDRVLVKDQSTASQNGIYIVGATPTRAADMDQDTTTTTVPAEEIAGAVVFVISGTVNTKTIWYTTNAVGGTVGSTSIVWAQFTGGAGGAASSITIADAGSYFTATDVEAALQELAKKDLGYTAHGSTGATETFDALTGWHSATLDSATVTATFTGATSGLVAAMVLELTQDGSGGRLVTWPGSVVWPGGSAPTLSTGAADTDILSFFSRDGGTTWYGFMAGSGGTGTGTLSTIEEVDGSPTDNAVTKLVLPNGTLSITSHVATYTPTGSGSASAPAVKAFYAQHGTNGTSDVVTISAASSGDRIILVTSSRGRDVNTPTCTNTTFTEVLAVNFSTTIYLSVYVGVVAGGASGTTITTTATGSNWIIQDAYVVADALTPTAGASASLTNTSASAVASTLVGPITCSVGDFFVFAATDDDGTTSITDVTTSSPAFSNPLGTNVALRSAIGRAGATSIVGYYTGGTAGSDLAAGVIAIT